MQHCTAWGFFASGFLFSRATMRSDARFLESCSFLIRRFRPGAEIASVLFLIRPALLNAFCSCWDKKRKFEKRGLVCFSSERWFHFNYFLISSTCTVNVSLLVGPRSHSPWGPCRNSAVALCPLVLTTSGQLLTMSLILYVAGSRTWQILIGKRQLVWTPSVLVLLCIRSPRWTFSTWPMWSLGAPRFLTSTAYSTAGICLN